MSCLPTSTQPVLARSKTVRTIYPLSVIVLFALASFAIGCSDDTESADNGAVNNGAANNGGTNNGTTGGTNNGTTGGTNNGTAAGCQFVSYASGEEFATAITDATTEDFEGLTAANGSWTICGASLSSATDVEGCATPGSIVDGVTITAENDQVEVTAFGDGWLGSENPPSGRCAGPSGSESGLVLTFDPPVSAVAFDSFPDDQVVDVELRFYDASDMLLGSTTGLAASGRPVFGGGSCGASVITRVVADPAPGTNYFLDDLRFKP